MCYEKPAINDNGTSDEDWDDYYEIDNAGKLFWFAQYVNNVDSSVDAKLTDNIDVNPGYDFNNDGSYTGGESPRVWVPIGTSADGSYLVYSGSFDGNGYTISGLYINNPEQSLCKITNSQKISLPEFSPFCTTYPNEIAEIAQEKSHHFLITNRISKP